MDQKISIFYITAPDGKLVQQKELSTVPEGWVFRLEYDPEPSGTPEPTLAVSRNKSSYNILRGQTILDKFKENGGIIPDLDESARETVIRELEELVAVGSKTKIIYPHHKE
jgi:hypothetical protein